jgi:tetratricopeptide (TPR) repeat protein
LIRMVESRLDRLPEERGAAAPLEAYDRGLILAPYFAEALRQFEASRDPLPDVFKGLVEGIRWEHEKGRGQAIAEQRDRAAALRAQERADEEARLRSREEIRSLLTTANRHLVAKEFEPARVVLDRALLLEPNNASALFGLAQVAAQQQALERALALYEQAAAHAREETWIAAWSYVHRGNIYRLQEELPAARAEWSRALKLAGELRGADEAARKALGASAP